MMEKKKVVSRGELILRVLAVVTLLNNTRAHYVHIT